MSRPAPPIVFAPARRLAARRRALGLQRRGDAPRYVLDDMAEDVLDRLAFVRHRPAKSLVIGDWSGVLAAALSTDGGTVDQADPATGFADDAPYGSGGYDLIVSLGTLDTVNDLPGALLHARAALSPGGLAIASFIGAGSLPALRQAMLDADGDRPAPRLHPMVDVRAGGQLLQRTGWADPVVDSRSIEVRFSSLASLVADLRAQGLSNCLARPGPPLTRAALARAAAAFGEKRLERIEILTLSGWKR